jgi:hypothetical protein
LEPTPVPVPAANETDRPTGARRSVLRAPQLPRELAEFLSLPESQVLLLRGPAGTGKSTLGAELLRRLEGNLVLVTPEEEGVDDRFSGSRGPEGASRVLRVSVAHEHRTSARAGEADRGFLLAAGPIGPYGRGERAPWIDEVVGSIPAGAHSFVVVDHWSIPTDDAEPSSGHALTSAAQYEREIHELRTALEGTATHLILIANTDPSEAAMPSVDGVLETGFEALTGGPIRILTLRKLRGVPITTARYPYSLANGRFRCVMPLPPNFQAPGAPPDPAPAEREGFLWPGSSEFAQVFGWLRFGAVTSIGLTEAVPDYVETSLATPITASALLSGGRAVWVPPPTRLPEEIVESLLRWVPAQTVADGLRILSAAGEPGNPLLDKILLRVQPSASTESTPSAGAGARVTPAFAEGHTFLQGTTPGRAALYLLSFDGLRAAAAVTGARYDPATFPILVARYARLPGFHGITIRSVDDPLASTTAGFTETVLRAEMRHGRVFLSGIRPETVPHALAWDEGDPRYRLVSMG